MKRTIEILRRLVAAPSRLVALLFAVCATSGAWATDSLEETGGFVTSSATLAFKNASIADLTATTMSARMNGDWVSTNVKGSKVVFCNFNYASDYSSMTCEAQIKDNTYIKGAVLSFTASGNDVLVSVTGVGNANTSSFSVGQGSIAGKNEAGGTAPAIAISATSAGYGVYGLRLPKVTDNRATVAWETGEFGTSKIGTDGNTYAIALNNNNNNTLDGDGNILIGDATTLGVTISLVNVTANLKNVAVLVKYRAPTGTGVPRANSVIAAVKESYDIGAICTTAEGGTVTGYYYDNGIKNNSGSYWALGNAPIARGSTGYFGFSHQCGGRGTVMFSGTDRASLTGGQSAGLKWDGGTITSIAIGGPNVAGANPWAGLVIEKIALFVDTSTGNGSGPFAAYQWPSEYTTQNYANWNYAPDIFTWNAGNADIGSSADNAATLFLRGTGTDSTKQVGRGGNTDYNGSAFWHNFCCNQSAYKAPGLTLRINTGSKIQAGFSALGTTPQGAFTLGGLIVESTGENCELQGNDTTNGRATILGSADGSETWFGIKANAFVKRTGYLVLSGIVNIDVAENKVFNLNEGGTEATTYGKDEYAPVVKARITNTATGEGATGGTLKMHGLGQIKVKALTATGSTLDYSDLAASRATPFVSGALAVDGDTIFKFPAAAGFPYPVATSVSSTASGDVTFFVGSDSFTRELGFTDGNAYPERRATFAGGETAINWSALSWDITYADEASAVSRITATASGTLALGTVSTGKVILEVPQGGVELTLTGTLAASEIVVTGAGTVVCSAANTLQGTVTGDGTIVYSALPTTGTGGATFTDTGWQGVLWLKNATVNNFNARNLGSTNSVLRFTGCTGYAYALSGESSYECSCTIDLQDDGETKALTLSDGYGGWRAIYKALTGTGTLYSNTATRHYYIFKDASAFAGSISLDTAALTHVVLGNATATDTANGSIYVASGASATVATGKTWSAPGGIDVKGILAIAGTGLVSGNVTASSGATLDFSDATADTRISGVLTTTAGVSIKLPTGATLPYRVASSGSGAISSYTIGEGTAEYGALLKDGQLVATRIATISSNDAVVNFGDISWSGTGDDYTLVLQGNATYLTFGDASVDSLKIVVQNNGELYVKDDLPENSSVDGISALAIAARGTETFIAGYTRLYSQIGTTTTGNGAINTAGNITVLSADEQALTSGNYTLARWLTPQKLSTGYGYISAAPTITYGVAAGLSSELVYMADRIALRVYDASVTPAADGTETLKVWPYGDSITEGFNGGGTKANYRVLLAQKLTLLGYNVEMVGCYGQIDQANGIDPSGKVIPDAWKWHSAKHGGTAGPTSATGRNNLQENVDTLAAQAGSPDVVLLHIGVNDLAASGQTPASTFTAWTNVVDRLSTDLPDSKIVATTLIYGDVSYSTRASQAPNITTFNGLVREFMANSKPAAWTNVIFLDMETKVGTYADKVADDGITYNTGSDWLHPDWWGHDQMAEAWLSVIESNFTPSGTFNASAAAAVDSSELGAAAKTELADYRKGFTRYGWFVATGAKDISSIAYNDVNASAATENIGRVGYFVEYVRADNNAHKWVWVDMDAFGTTIAELGLPAANHQQIVKHLHVKSNHNGIEDVAADDDSVSGWVEFSPNDYAGTVSGIRCSPSGNASVYDWNDALSEEANVDSGTNACMQVFRMAPGVPSGRGAQTLFAYNNWRSSTLGAEFGIGNFSSHYYGGANEAQTIDYTKTRSAVKMNAEAYTVKRIEIWTNPNKVGITTDGQGSNQNNSTYANSVNWSLNISQASPLTANDTKVKVDSISIGMRPDVSLALAVMRLVVKDATSGDVLGTSELANGTGTTSGKAYANGAIRQEYKFAQDLLLDIGTTYTLEMVDSSGAKVQQGFRLETTTTAPIYNDHGDNTTYRITQDLCLSRVHVASVAADVASFGALTFSPALPTDYSDSALLVNVTADATVTLGAATTVGSIRFAVAEGATLTIADPANINAGEVVFYGPGRVAFTGAPDFGAADVEFAGSPTVALALGQTIATTGDVVIDKNATVTFEPATITDPTAALVAAASLANNGTITVTAPDQGSDYSVVATATGVTLRRVTKEAFAYNPVPGDNTPTGWITSWGNASYAGEEFSTTSLRVGPSSATPFVYHVQSGNHPWADLTAKSAPFSIAFYADLSSLEAGNRVLMALGTTDNGLIIYKNDDAPGTVRVGRATSGSIDAGYISVEYPKTGYHLYTITCAADGTLCAYVDDGSVYKASNADGTKISNSTFGTGFQIGSTYQGNISWMSPGVGMAVAAVRGYDVALDATEVSVLAESFPATDRTFDWDILFNESGKTLTVHTSTMSADSGRFLGICNGTLTIPAGSTVTVPSFRTMTRQNTSDSATVNIAGTLAINSTSGNKELWNNGRLGIIAGVWQGNCTYNVTGAINAPNAYIEMPYSATSGNHILSVDGGTVVTRGFYAYSDSNNGDPQINLSNGGVVEVSEMGLGGYVITKSFGYGTYRVKATGTEGGSIAFTSTATAQPTTLDPYGCTLTLSGMTGAGYITVADSSTDGNGQVVFPAQGSFTGAIILTDDNAENMVISAYTGKIVLRGTAAATIDKLDGYTGIVIIDQAGTYDATAIDLSGATVQITHANATLNATAGKEGNVAVIAGTCNLYTDNNTFLYDGHVFAGGVNSVGATLNYIHSEAYSVSPLSWEIGAAFSAEELAEVKSGNNIAPYFKIFVGHADGDDMAGSLATATDWNGHTAEDEAPTSGNMAIRVSDGKTLTIDVSSAVSFGEVQVFGSGSVVFTGSAALTVTKGMYVTPGTTVEANGTNLAFMGDGNPGIHVDYGLTEAASGKVVLADGTAQSPYAPYIYGQGAVEVPAGAVASLANQQNAISYLTVDGTATAAASSTALAALSALTVSATGELSVPADATVSPATLTVNGTMNMASTATLSNVTTLSGTGGVYYTGKLPDGSWWNTGTASGGWRGTVGIKDYSSSSANEWNINYYGSQYSTLEVDNCYAYYFTKSENVIGPTLKLVGNGLKVANGNGGEQTIFKALSGSGTLTKEGTPRHCTNFGSSPEFYGSIVNRGRRLVFGNSIPNNTDAAAYSITVDRDYEVSLGDGATWSSKRMSINGTLLVKGTGNLTVDSDGGVTFGNGATLTFDDIGNNKLLSLNVAPVLAAGSTVNIAFGDGVAPVAGTKLISWGGAPEGEFAFADSSLADNYCLVKTASGLEVAQWGVVTLTTGANVTSITGVANGAKVKPGDTVSFTVATADGYDAVVTVGNAPLTADNGTYSYMVEGNVTITVTTVSTAVTFGAATFDYYATYASAKTVTAAVTGHVVDGTTFTMTVGENNYTGTYANGVVTFSDVTVGGLGTTTSYTITATGGSTGTSPFSAAVGSTEASSGWMSWSESGSNVGGWTDELGTTRTPTYSDGVAALTGTNTYTAAWISTGEVVTVTTNVKFGDVADPDMTIDANAQAAVRLFDDNGVTFQVWNGDDWVNVSNGTLGTPSGDETYQVEVKLNYSTQKYGVKIGEYQLALTGSNPAVTLFPLAKAASAMQQVSYLGAGSFISLSGQYVSAGYTADVGTKGSATNVVVSSDFVNTYMSDKLASEISDLLDPNATKETKPNAIAANGYNYFTSYALGLDPTEKDDKVIVDVTTDDSGKFVFTVKHPVFDGEGNITGYKQVTEAANVTTTVTLKYGTSTGELNVTTDATKIAPADMDFSSSSVLYYKAEVTIGAK